MTFGGVLSEKTSACLCKASLMQRTSFKITKSLRPSRTLNTTPYCLDHSVKTSYGGLDLRDSTLPIPGHPDGPGGRFLGRRIQQNPSRKTIRKIIADWNPSASNNAVEPMIEHQIGGNSKHTCLSCNAQCTVLSLWLYIHHGARKEHYTYKRIQGEAGFLTIRQQVTRIHGDVHVYVQYTRYTCTVYIHVDVHVHVHAHVH